MSTIEKDMNREDRRTMHNSGGSWVISLSGQLHETTIYLIFV